MNTQLSLVDGGYLTEKQLFALENWMLQGKGLARDLKAHGKETEKGEGQLLWELGDWLIHGEVHGRLGKSKLRKTATAATGYKWTYLKNLKVVSRAIPPYRRRNGLSYSIHRELCPADEATQERLLTEALNQQIAGGRVSVRDIRKEVKKAVGSVGIKGSKLAKAQTGGTGEVVQIVLSMQNYNALQAVLRDFNFNDVGHMVGQLMFDIVRNYFKQNNDEIKARREAYRVANEEQMKAAKANTPERRAYRAYLEWYSVERKKWTAECDKIRDTTKPPFTYPPQPKWIPSYDSPMLEKPFLPGMEEYFRSPYAAEWEQRYRDNEEQYKTAMEEWVQAHQSLISKDASPTAAEVDEPEDPDDLRPPE